MNIGIFNIIDKVILKNLFSFFFENIPYTRAINDIAVKPIE